MKKIYLLLLLLPFFLSDCKTKNSKNVTTDPLEGTVWVEAYYDNNLRLTNVSVLTFTSSDECNILFAGNTVNSHAYQCNYKIESSKIIITPISGDFGNTTFECVVKQDELLMYTNFPDVGIGMALSPTRYKKLY